MPTYSADILPSSTGLKLGSISQEWDAILQNLTVYGTATFINFPLNAAIFEGIYFADGFIGGTPTLQIDDALSQATTMLCVAPSTMGAGNATSIGGGQCLLDLRAGVPKFFTSASPSIAALVLNNDGTLAGTFKTTSANNATTGAYRLANTDAIVSRNAGNSLDLNIANMNSSNVLVLGDAGGCSMTGQLTIGGALTISGALSDATTGSFAGQITSTLGTGTAPFSIASTTVVPNLNVQVLNGVTISSVAPTANQVLSATSASTAAWSSTVATGFSILDKQDTAAPIVGNSADQTIYTYSMPSGTLTAGKGIRITTFLLHSTGATSTTYKIFFGATACQAVASTSVLVTSIICDIFNNAGSTTAQWSSSIHNLGASTSTSVAAPAENTNSGGNIVIKVTFNVANTDQLTPYGWLVEKIA